MRDISLGIRFTTETPETVKEAASRSGNQWRFSRSCQKNDFDDPDSVGALFAVPMPEGDYEVFQWAVGSGTASVFPTETFAIPFTVESGKVLYLGSFQFTQTASKGLTVTGVTLEFKDAASRDLAVMRKKFPNLAETPLCSTATPDTNMSEVGGKSAVRFDIPFAAFPAGNLR